jgi:hypothetical protein
MSAKPANPAAGGSAAPTEGLPQLYRTVRVIVIFLMALDVGALWLLLWRAGVHGLWALGLAFFVGGLTSYRAQFQNLLSPREFRHHGSPLRLTLMALFVLAVNAAGFWLVAVRLYFGYLGLRLFTALVVVWAWGRREGPRILGNGVDAVRRRLSPPAPAKGPGKPEE